MARLVLTDASPLIGLSRVEGVAWLGDLFGRVEMTASVLREVVASEALEQGISDAMERGWLLAREEDPSGPERPPHLGAGEWSTILAARDHEGPVLVLMDDRLARREAISAGCRVAGTAAVIGIAARRGIVRSAPRVFERLIQSDFRIAPEVIRSVLEQVEGR